jgi:hypothetical protein
MSLMPSTRLAIVRQALDDILERLDELPASPRVLDLRQKADSYAQIVRRWDTEPPTEGARAAMLKTVLELNVAVIEAGKAHPAP